MRSNCLIQSVKQWIKEGFTGYINIRLSRNANCFHFTYHDIYGRIFNFKPVEDVLLTDRIGMPPIVFNGHYIDNDYAWFCHQMLRKQGWKNRYLRKLTDKQVISLYEVING